MKLVWTNRRLAWCVILLSISSWTGCGGSSSAPPAASQAAAPPSTPPGSPGDGGAGVPAQDPTAMSSPPGDGYEPPPDSSATAGMPTGDGYVSDGYGQPGDGMPGGGIAGFGIPGFGMPGMGSPGMGMPGMGMPGVPGANQLVDPAPEDDADYLTKARYAFAIGKESEAMQYFVAHVMSRENEAAGLLEQVRWSPGARKPALAARFAVGVDLKAPPNIPDVKPIGRSQMAGDATGAAGDNAGMDMTSGPGGAAAPGGAGGGKTLGDLTGLFGKALVDAFESAWKNGDFGSAFKDTETIQPRPPRLNNAMGMMGMGMGGLDSGGGIPGADGGAGYDSGMVAGDGVSNPLAQPKDAALRLKAVAGKPVVPGLLFLGTGSVSDLAVKAEKQGIDYMFVFEVNVKAQRGLIQNDTRLRLVPTVDKEGVTVASSVLNNLKVDRERMQKGETDDLDKQIGNVFRKVELLKLADLPKLTPAQAQARVKSLIDKKPADVLSTLMEIRLYNALGVLENDERDAAYQLLLGGTGLAFVTGTVEDRESVLSPLLPAYK